jgi:isoleucyl-tRNA synthetase
VFSYKQKDNLLKVKDIILEEINVKELKVIEGDSEIIIKKAKPNFKSIGPKYGKEVKNVQEIISKLSNTEINKIEKDGEVEKNGYNIKNEDIEIFTENIEGWIVEIDKNLTVALDTTLDQDLIEEGIVREFINRVQNYRKTNKFDVNDKIIISLKTTENINQIINKNIDFIKGEVYCEDILKADGKSDNLHKTDINGEMCEFFIEKIKN